MDRGCSVTLIGYLPIILDYLRLLWVALVMICELALKCIV